MNKGQIRTQVWSLIDKFACFIVARLFRNKLFARSFEGFRQNKLFCFKHEHYLDSLLLGYGLSYAICSSFFAPAIVSFFKLNFHAFLRVIKLEL